MVLCGEGWGWRTGKGFQENSGVVWGPCGTERCLPNLCGRCSAQLWSSAASTELRRPEWGSGCGLPLLGQQGVVERGLRVESEDSGMSLSSGTRCLISLGPYFPNWKTRRKITHWMCLTGVVYSLNKNSIWKALCKLESSIKIQAVFSSLWDSCLWSLKNKKKPNSFLKSLS